MSEDQNKALITDLCWQWFQDAVGQQINVFGPLKALKLKEKIWAI
jgi:hypothetical protein